VTNQEKLPYPDEEKLPYPIKEKTPWHSQCSLQSAGTGSSAPAQTVRSGSISFWRPFRKPSDCPGVLLRNSTPMLWLMRWRGWSSSQMASMWWWSIGRWRIV